MRVEEYLDYRAKLKGVDRKQRPQRLEDCLDRCRIREVRRRLLGTLSKGYRQRVGLADAMIHDPVVLILDEPTAGFDVRQQDETLALIKELGQEHTVIFSTHRLAEVEAICRQVVLIYQGRVRLHKQLKDLESDAPILLEARGPLEQVTNLLKTTEGVERVSSHPVEDGVNLYEVRTPRQQGSARGAGAAAGQQRLRTAAPGAATELAGIFQRVAGRAQRAAEGVPSALPLSPTEAVTA